MLHFQETRCTTPARPFNLWAPQPAITKCSPCAEILEPTHGLTGGEFVALSRSNKINIGFGKTRVQADLYQRAIQQVVQQNRFV